MIHTFTSNVLEKKQITESVVQVSLSCPDVFTFKAGQFITLFIEKDGEKKPRSYSILNPPSQKRIIDLCIKIVEGGYASEVFNSLSVGDELEVKGPFGHFLYEQGETDVWMLSAGTGVVPFYSMLKEHLSTSNRKFTLLFGVRNQKNLCYNDEFIALAEKYENFEYKPVLSREEWEGLQGHVQDNLPEDLNNKTFYICGLKELVLETKEKLVAKGVPADKIKSERYS